MSIKLKPKRSGPETYGVGYSVFRLFFGPENSLAQTSSNSLGAAGPVPAAARTTDRGQLPHPDPTNPSMRLTCPNLACCYGGWWDYDYEFHSWTEPDAEDRGSARGWKSLNQAKAEYARSPDGASKWPELSSGLPTNEDPYRYVWEEEKLSDVAAAAKWDEIERTQDRKTVRNRLRSLFGLVEAGGAGAGAATSEAEALEAQAAGRMRLEAVIGHRTYFPRETDGGNHDNKRPLPPDDLALLRFFDKPRQFRLRRFRVKDVSAPLGPPPPLELQTYPAAVGPRTAEPADDVEKKRDHTGYEPASDGFPLGRYRVLPHEIYPGIWRVSPCGGYLFLYAAEEPGKIYRDQARRRRGGENKMRPNKEASRGSGFRLWKWKLADITDKSAAAGEISSAARRDDTTSSPTSPLRKKAKLDKDEGQQESLVDTEKVEAGRAYKDDAPTRGGKDDLLLDHADFVFPGPNKAAFSYPARCVSKAWRAHACEFRENVAMPEGVDRESVEDGSEDAGVSEGASSNETDQDDQSESWYDNDLVREYGAAHHRGWNQFLAHDPFFFVTNQVVLRRWGIQSKKVLGVWSRPTQVRFFDYETNAELRSYALDNLFRAWNVRFKTSAWDSGADRRTFAPHADYDPGYGREDFELAAGEDLLDGAIVGLSPDARFIFLQLTLRASCLVDADSDPIREMFGRISKSRKTSSGEWWKHLQPFPYVLLMWDLADGLDGNRVTLLPGCPNNRDVKYEQVEGSGLRSVDHHASGETVRTVKITSVEQGKDEDGDEKEGGRPGAPSTATTNEVAVSIVSWAKFLEDFTESGATVDSSDFVLRLRAILPPQKPSEGSPDHISATQGQTKCLSQPEELPRRLHQLLYETNLSQQMMPVDSVQFRLEIKTGTSKGNEFVTGVNPELQGVVHTAINETKGLQFLQVRKR